MRISTGNQTLKGNSPMILEGERRPSHGIGNPFVHDTKVYRVFIFTKSNPHDAVLSRHDAALNWHDAEKY